MPVQGQKFKLRLTKERWDFLNLYFIGSVKDFFCFSQELLFVCLFLSPYQYLLSFWLASAEEWFLYTLYSLLPKVVWRDYIIMTSSKICQCKPHTFSKKLYSIQKQKLLSPRTRKHEQYYLCMHLQCQEHYQWNNRDLTIWNLSLVD